MPDNAHTKGEWSYHDNGETCTVRDYCGNQIVIMAHLGGNERREISEVKANGRLISAAPNLLAALRAILNDDAISAMHEAKRQGRDGATVHVSLNDYYIARAAIEKAKSQIAHHHFPRQPTPTPPTPLDRLKRFAILAVKANNLPWTPEDDAQFNSDLTELIRQEVQKALAEPTTTRST